LNADGTGISSYTGTDTCFLFNGSYWGIPNIEGIRFNWRRVAADTIYMKFQTPTAKEFVVLHAVVNQKSQLIRKDTVASMDWMSVKTYIK
jgi:hypothetical protein